MADDPAKAAAQADAARTDCCANGEWRGRFCQYHQGFEDGYDAALLVAANAQPNQPPRRDAGGSESQVAPGALADEERSAPPASSGLRGVDV